MDMIPVGAPDEAPAVATVAITILREYALAFGQDYRRLTYTRDDAEEWERSVEGDLLRLAEWGSGAAAAPATGRMREILDLCPAGRGHYTDWCDKNCAPNPIAHLPNPDSDED